MDIPPALALPAVALGLVVAPLTSWIGISAHDAHVHAHVHAHVQAQVQAQPKAGATVASAPSNSWHVGYYSANAVGVPAMTQTTLCLYRSRIATAGSQLRLEFADSGPTSNTSSFHIAGAYVSLRSRAALLTFHGQKTVNVKAHSSVLSDPVNLSVRANDDLVLAVKVDHGDRPQALVGAEANSCSPFFGGVTGTPIRWLQSIQVYGPATRVVGTVGDSITEGLGLVPGSHTRWTDVLDSVGNDVVNGGVTAGNLDGLGPLGSADGLHRLPTVLAEPGLTDVVVAMGTNDIGLGHSAAQVLADLQHAVQIAAAKHVRVSVATILPRGGSRAWTNKMELVRSQVNGALRSWSAKHQFTLIDLDLALRDPHNHEQLLPAYRQADRCHPNAAGHRAVARTVAQALGLTVPR